MYKQTLFISPLMQAAIHRQTNYLQSNLGGYLSHWVRGCKLCPEIITVFVSIGNLLVHPSKPFCVVVEPKHVY